MSGRFPPNARRALRQFLSKIFLSVFRLQCVLQNCDADRMRNVHTIAATLLLALLVQPLAAHAGTLGGISGVVTDAETGAPVAGAHLTITSGSQAATATTDSSGHYIVFTLQPDDYTITAEKDGYEATSLGGCTVFADQTQIYDLKLPPAGAQNR